MSSVKMGFYVGLERSRENTGLLCFPNRCHLAPLDAWLVFEHVTQQLLHGCAANGPVEEQLLYFLRAHKVEGRQQK